MTKHHRVGFYKVDNTVFFNKADALAFASVTKGSVYWNFNDDVFSAIDWSIPIETSLQELYKQRAQQLRDKYDFISLNFSGGVDSGNVLHSFIDNDIFLDEIIIYRPKVLDNTYNTTDKRNVNLFSETEFAAIPHLRKVIKDNRTIIRIVDMDVSMNNFLCNSALVDQYHTMNLYMPSGLAKLAMSLDDKIWNNLYSAGKNICHIHGIDKPMIRYDAINDTYFFQFGDVAVAAAASTEPDYDTPLSDMITEHQFHELFYWTPDFPLLVIKQCQVVKENMRYSDWYKMMFGKSNRLKEDKFTFMYPWIYPPQVIALRDAFCVQKNGLDLYAGQHSWVYERMPEYAKGSFNNIIKNMQSSIHSRFFRGPGNINYYLEDPDVNSPKTSFRTLLSKKHFL
jgi:hypothetical protein